MFDGVGDKAYRSSGNRELGNVVIYRKSVARSAMGKTRRLQTAESGAKEQAVAPATWFIKKALEHLLKGFWVDNSNRCDLFEESGVHDRVNLELLSEAYQDMGLAQHSVVDGALRNGAAILPQSVSCNSFLRWTIISVSIVIEQSASRLSSAVTAIGHWIVTG